jgi:hypothetical protein
MSKISDGSQFNVPKQIQSGIILVISHISAGRYLALGSDELVAMGVLMASRHSDVPPRSAAGMAEKNGSREAF